ncbi:hypothetical protein SLA2020_351420 [Shorea laevis]
MAASAGAQWLDLAAAGAAHSGYSSLRPVLAMPNGQICPQLVARYGRRGRGQFWPRVVAPRWLLWDWGAAFGIGSGSGGLRIWCHSLDPLTQI